MTTKSCSKCKKIKVLECFSIRDKAKGYYRSECKECVSISSRERYERDKSKYTSKSREYRKLHKIEVKNGLREWNLKTNFGMTIQNYEELLDKQNGTCDICNGINENGNRLSVDHDHNTGKIRSLLCSNCNLMIGNAREDVVVLNNAIEYIKKHNK